MLPCRRPTSNISNILQPCFTKTAGRKWREGGKRGAGRGLFVDLCLGLRRQGFAARKMVRSAPLLLGG